MRRHGPAVAGRPVADILQRHFLCDHIAVRRPRKDSEGRAESPANRPSMRDRPVYRIHGAAALGAGRKKRGDHDSPGRHAFPQGAALFCRIRAHGVPCRPEIPGVDTAYHRRDNRAVVLCGGRFRKSAGIASGIAVFDAGVFLADIHGAGLRLSVQGSAGVRPGNIHAAAFGHVRQRRDDNRPGPQNRHDERQGRNGRHREGVPGGFRGDRRRRAHGDFHGDMLCGIGRWHRGRRTDGACGGRSRTVLSGRAFHNPCHMQHTRNRHGPRPDFCGHNDDVRRRRA